jgi:hypothetical protein
LILRERFKYRAKDEPLTWGYELQIRLILRHPREKSNKIGKNAQQTCANNAKSNKTENL